MCQEWQDSFAHFLAWVGPKPEADLTLDRINNDKGYERGNVRWANVRVQATNKRRRKDAHLITIQGVTKPLSEWPKQSRLAKNTILNRMVKGYKEADWLKPADPKRQTRGKPNES